MEKSDSQDNFLIKDLLLQLDDFFLIVVAGEYNSGKSAFINALLGQEFLKTGVTPTTSDITILRYGKEKQSHKISAGQTLMELPAPILEGVSIVDTPGTNAIQREHEALTTDFIPRSDLVIFITSVDRPFTESERVFLETIRNWGKKVVILINKVDIIESKSDLEEVKIYVSDNAKKLIGVEPKLFFISAKNSLKQKLELESSDPFLADVEKFIESTLNPEEKIPLKLLNPLGVLDKLLSQNKDSTEKKLELLSNDIQLLIDLESQIGLFREDMIRSFKFRYSEIDNILLEFEKRGLEFFDNTFRIARIMDLLNKEKIQSEYNKTVLRGLSQEIDRKVEGLIDWLVEEDLRQWQVITQKIDQRVLKYQDRILDNPETRHIHFERQKIIDSVRRESQRVVELFDKDEESRKIAEDAQMAVAASAAIEVGALGLGALVTLLATTASADLTGILLAGLTATLGFFIIPAKKKQARYLFSKNIIELREKLSNSLLDEFSTQVDHVIARINSTIQPYSRFVKSEQSNLENNLATYGELLKRSVILRDEIGKI
ncbi:MAG TPA: dynamin family protein [Pelolinea sp.]|nr:dynamin family protein [Pelolinea sp.]